MRIFATSVGYLGNLGGIGGAHQKCQAAAAARGYQGVFRALLSNTAINARELLTVGYPVLRASDGGLVESSDLFAGPVQNAIGKTVDGVWTGSRGPTMTPAECCADWRSSTGTGTHGDPAVATAAWFGGGSHDCTNLYGLYCLEQPAPLGAVLAISPRTAVLLTAEKLPASGTPVTLTVENVGDAPSATIGIKVSDTAHFEVASDACTGKTLASGSTCAVTLRLSATTPGTLAGTLVVTANNQPQATLKGAAGSLAFLTTVTFSGDLGGPDGADAACSSRAKAVGLGGTFKAVLSTDTVDAKSRFSIRYPVITTSADVIASANFWTQSPENKGARDERGVHVQGAIAWAGTLSGGTKATETCSGWTSSSGNGATVNPTGYWCSTAPIFAGCASFSPKPCSSLLPLLCLGE